MVVKIKDIGEIITGNTPSKKEESYWDSEDICFVKPDIISDTGISIIEDSNEYISKNARNRARVVGKGTVLVTCIGSIGKVGIVSNDESAFNQQINAIVPYPTVNARYLAYAMIQARPRLEAIANAPVVPIINKTQFGDFQINIENDVSKQEIIVLKLDKLYAIIESRKKELAKLDELTKARFVEMFGDPLNGTEKWPLHTVGDVAESVDPQPSHRTPPVDQDGVPYVSIKDCDYKTGKIDFDNARKVGRYVLDEHRRRYTLHDGDFIIGKIGTIGNPIFVPARDDYTLSANIVLVQPYRNKVSPYFLKYSFMSAFMERQFEDAKNSTSQAAFGIQKVRQTSVMNPDLVEQYKFEEFAKQVDKSKAEVQKSLDEAQILFDSLMQQYFG